MQERHFWQYTAASEKTANSTVGQSLGFLRYCPIISWWGLSAPDLNLTMLNLNQTCMRKRFTTDLTIREALGQLDRSSAAIVYGLYVEQLLVKKLETSWEYL